MLMYICAKFGACITKCTIGLLCCPTICIIHNGKTISSKIGYRYYYYCALLTCGDEVC